MYATSIFTGYFLIAQELSTKVKCFAQVSILFLQSMYLTKSRIQCHSLLHQGLGPVACPVTLQRTDLLSPRNKKLINKRKKIEKCIKDYMSILVLCIKLCVITSKMRFLPDML